MTAIGPAPAQALNVPTPPHASRQGAGDRFAFAAVLDSLPRAEAPNDPAVARDQAARGDEQGATAQAQPDLRAALIDSALMASLPFAAPSRPASAESRPAAGGTTPAAVPKAIPETGEGGAPHAVSSDRTNVAAGARLVGERTFLPSPSYSGGATAASLQQDALANAVARAATPAMPDLAAGVAGASSKQGVSANAFARAATPATRDQAAGGGRKFAAAAAASAPSVHLAKPASHASEPGESSAMGPQAGVAPPDPGPSGAGAAAPGRPADAQQPAPILLAGTPSRETPGSTAGAAGAAPRVNAIPVGQAPAASPIKEIDVDLSPGGLEHVSMTMRLAGDRLSVVIRAASSQTLGAIESARDAIADRLAAIGQPLGGLIIQQTDATADGTRNANSASGEERPASGERDAGQRAAGRGDPNDSGARRGGSSGDL